MTRDVTASRDAAAPQGCTGGKVKMVSRIMPCDFSYNKENCDKRLGKKFNELVYEIFHYGTTNKMFSATNCRICLKCCILL